MQIPKYVLFKYILDSSMKKYRIVCQYEEDQNKSPAVIRERETRVYYIVYITEENFSKYITGG